jgi:hypothetical protein
VNRFALRHFIIKQNHHAISSVQSEILRWSMPSVVPRPARSRDGALFFAEPFRACIRGEALFNIVKIARQQKVFCGMTFLLEIEKHNDYIALLYQITFQNTAARLWPQPNPGLRQGRLNHKGHKESLIIFSLCALCLCGVKISAIVIVFSE